MSEFILIWLAAGLSGLLIIWGVNVPARHRTPVTFGLMAFIFVFAVLAQTWQQAVDEAERNFSPPALMELEGSSLRKAVSSLATQPGMLLSDPPSHILQTITSSFTHYGWLPLIMNLWFMGVFGHALERIIGSLRFTIIALACLILPAILDGIIPFLQFAEFTGGTSGLVYGILAAVLIRMPRSRMHVAVNSSPEFWAAILLLLGPMTFIAMHANIHLVQIVIIIGFAAAFYIVQPVFTSFSVPVWGAVVYRLIIDVALLWPLTNPVIGNSPWRILGGVATGALTALACCGVRGFSEMWGEQPVWKAPRTKSRVRSAKQVQKAAEYDEETARNFLGQRVFIADASTVVDFYTSVIMEKFPSLVLPPQEQLSLARMLHSKFREPEALHAYEAYLRTYTVDYEHWIVWLTAAELLRKVDPDRTEDARHYLTTFMENTAIMMRDRMEAERLLKELPPKKPKKVYKVEADPEAKTDKPGFNYTGLKNLPSRKHTTAPSSSPPSAESVMMPRLTPTCFAVVNGVPQDEIRRSRTSQSADKSSDTLPSAWIRHPLRTRPDPGKENILPLKVKHNWDHAAQSSGAYGVDKPGATSRSRPGSRMAQVEAVKSSTYGAGESNKHTWTTEDHTQPDRTSANYGGVTDHPSDAPRPKLRLRREKEKQEGSGAGGGT